MDAGPCTMIAPMMQISGNFCVTSERIYFAPAHPKLYKKNVFSFKIEKICMLLLRRYQHEDVAIEFVAKRKREEIEDELQCFGQLTTRKVMYIVFKDAEVKNKVYDLLKSQVDSNCLLLDKGIEEFQKQWVDGQLSNFEYLMIVNCFAQRSFQDLTQYPVMPWVLADYSQEIIDFSSNTQFRDLSKPIGALGEPERL